MLLTHAVDIEISVTDITESSVQISVNCTELLPSNLRDFAIKVTANSSQNVSFPCLADLHFINLTPSVTYNITVVWLDLSLPTECVVEEFTILSGKGQNQQLLLCIRFYSSSSSSTLNQTKVLNES